MMDSALRQIYGLDALEPAVRQSSPTFVAQAVHSIDSTNTELMRRAKAGDYRPSLLIAQTQTAGKGRMGKPWQSAAGRSLAMSIGWVMQPQQWHGLSLVLGMVVAQEIQKLRPPEAGLEALGLKWPNDLWVMDGAGNGRKLAGILVETVAVQGAGGQVQAKVDTKAPAANTSPERYVVMGIGINLRPPQQGDDMVFSMPPVSMAELAPEVEVAQLVNALVPALVAALAVFEREGFAPWHRHYAQWDVLRARAVALSDGRTGMAQGVNAQGELLLDTAQGQDSITSGELSVRPVAT